MKNCSFLLLAFVILASASCSGTDETVLPVQADHGTRTEDQSRLVPYVNGRIDSVKASISPYKGVFTVTVFNNTVGYPLRPKSLGLTITDPTTGEIRYEYTQDIDGSLSIPSGKTASYQRSPFFYNLLVAGRTYDVTATFTYHVSITEDYPLGILSKTVSATVPPQL